MSKQIRLGLAQINTTVGDFAGNADKMLRAIDRARALGVDLLAFPELAVCGYPPEDLLLKSQFIERNLLYLQKLVMASAGLGVIAGFVDCQGGKLYNAAAIIYDGELREIYRKIFLPNYGVFDERRYFTEGKECPVFRLGDVKLGVNICEDIWYECGPATAEAAAGAELIINISASPYHYRKAGERHEMLTRRALNDAAFITYNNLVGGLDELVFDGNSLVIDAGGRGCLARGLSLKRT
jgi:NAD+ synthase (glutamine-hydrolysing)